MTNVHTDLHWSADYRWWLVIGALLSGLVWRVAQKNNVQPTSSNAPPIGSFELNHDQLPPDWSINYDTDSLVGLSQTSASGCFVDVNRRELSSVSLANAAEFEQEIIRDNRETIEDNGYTYTDLGEGELAMRTNHGQTSLPSHEFEARWVENETYFRQSLAIVVGEGKYLTINLSCSEPDLSPAQSALQAVEFGL